MTSAVGLPVGMSLEGDESRNRNWPRAGHRLWDLGGGEFHIGNCLYLTGMGYSCIVGDESILSEGVPVWHLT
jgi:hypothetical protein